LPKAQSSRFWEGWHTYATYHVLIKGRHYTRKVEETGGWRGALCRVERFLHYLVTAGNRKTWPLDRIINGPRCHELSWTLRLLLLYGRT